MPMLIPRKVMYRLLRRALSDEITVLPAVDANGITKLPLLTFSTTIGAALGGVEPPIAWEASTTINVFAENEDDAEAICAAVYDLVHTFNDPFATPRTGLIEGYAVVVEVTDQGGFDLVATAVLEGRNVVQYSGTFSHQVHADG